MKLRLADDSIRFRLTQADIDRLATDGLVAGGIELGGAAGNFTYELVVTDGPGVTAIISANGMRVSVPRSRAEELAGSQIGIYENIQTGTGKEVQITIEKDLKCINPGPSDDKPELYGGISENRGT